MAERAPVGPVGRRQVGGELARVPKLLLALGALAGPGGVGARGGGVKVGGPLGLGGEEDPAVGAARGLVPKGLRDKERIGRRRCWLVWAHKF